MKPPEQPYRISQIAVVVKDIDAAMKTYHEMFGWGPWNVYEHVPPKLHHQHLHGEPSNYSMIGAECEVQPGLIVELIQPLEGDSIYKEHPATRSSSSTWTRRRTPISWPSPAAATQSS